MTKKQTYLSLTIIYIVSRIILYQFHFETKDTCYYWQILDPISLKDNLFESLYYLHSQPPLFNFIIGLLIKISPQHYNEILSLIYMGLTILLSIALFEIFIFFKIPIKLSFILSVIYMLLPETILYESWIFYTWLDTALLIFSIFFLIRYIEKGSWVYLVLFFIDILSLMLIRSLFHLIYLIGLVAILIIFQRFDYKRILLSALIPFTLVTALYLKNYQLFGFFGSSSWLGMSISKVATLSILDDYSLKKFISTPFAKEKKEIDKRLIKLYLDGKVSSTILTGAFKSLDSYESRYIQKLPTQYQNIHILRDAYKYSGHTNLNQYSYINISKTMMKDSIYLITQHPLGYIKVMIKGFIQAMKPSWDYPFVIDNTKKIQSYIDIFELEYLGGKLAGKYGVISYILMPLSLLISILYLIYAIIKKDRYRVVTTVMIYDILFVLGVSIAVEIGELNRMRVMIDPLLYILSIIAIYRIVIYLYHLALSKE